MGTRGLTMVISDKKTRIAQYGQWDHYPKGQGVRVLKFLREVDKDAFRERLRSLNWLTEEQSKDIGNDPDWDIHHPYLSRDAGADILNAIMYGELRYAQGDASNNYKRRTIPVTVAGLVDSSAFAGDSLFCEWAYVIDMDNDVLEVYKGYSKTRLTPEDRFYYLQEENDDFAPVKLCATFNINALPKDGDFINLLATEEQET